MHVRLFLHLNGNIYNIMVDSTEIMMMLFFEEWVELINSGFCLLWFFEPVFVWSKAFNLRIRTKSFPGA
jgi:hypothetical protein